ncbi:mechanosensitive ion channel domain-containing protein [Acaryochloris thomasi]|uniref:mechanosensitive ion channel domain-containing protein n=1 Tax=Acaryochloris thomasi TaxID=2929456 RepID=UPI001313DAA5|nr:mechanosensitive ion channel domain-containing protein [Acaryochloris thomasi]
MQTTPSPIVIDGRVLFQVHSISGFSAKDRADPVNQSLMDSLSNDSSTEPPRVQIVRQDNLLTLRLNDQHLLTVTERDLLPGVMPREQAQRWQDWLNKALQKAQQERTPGYQRKAFGLLALALMTTISLHMVVNILKQRLLLRYVSLNPQQSSVRRGQSLVFLGILGLKGILWVTALIYTTDLFPLVRRWRFQVWYSLEKNLWFPLFQLGENNYSLADMLLLLGLIVGLWLLVGAIVRFLKAQVLSFTGIEKGPQETIATLAHYGLTSIGSLGILQAWGIDISSLAIIASVLGVGIGFGLQGLVNNFVSGIVLLIERPIQVGDFIDLDGLFGTIEHIGTRSTQIRRLDQVSVFVPNSELVSQRLINWNYGQRVVRVTIPVKVAYSSDIDQVRQVLLGIAKHHDGVLGYPQPLVLFTDLGDSGLNLLLVVSTRMPKNQFLLKSDLQYLIVKRFQEYKIRIPYNQHDLHVQSPQLNALVDTWTQQQTPQPTELYYPNAISRQGTIRSSTFESTPEDIGVGAMAKRRVPLQGLDIEQLTNQMRSQNGIDIKDRTYRLRSYPKSFLGCEAVDWLMHTQGVSTQEAIKLGQILIDRGVIHHVTDEQPFQDGYFFYRFYDDEI